MNTLLELLSFMDWLTPLLSLLDKEAETITLNMDELWAIDNLKRQGLKVRRITPAWGGRVIFDVPANQIGLATLKLRKMGIPVESRKGRPWNRQ